MKRIIRLTEGELVKLIKRVINEGEIDEIDIEGTYLEKPNNDYYRMKKLDDTFVKDYGLREMALIPNKSSTVDTDMAPGEIKFESVDQIVTDQITAIESEFYDTKLLLKIYQNLSSSKFRKTSFQIRWVLLGKENYQMDL